MTPYREDWRLALGLLLLVGAILGAVAAFGQTQSVERLAWSCTNQAIAGQSVVGNTCATAQQRWDFGDSGNLVAACASNCASWRDAIWRSWNDATAQVFLCRSPKVPGPWSACSDEGFAARAQVATTPPPPPPPQPAEPHPPSNTHLRAQSLGLHGVRLTWEAVVLRVDGTPTTETIDYRVETAGGEILGEVRNLDFEIDQAPPGRRCYRVRAIEAGRASPWTSQDDPQACIAVATKITITSSEGLNIRLGSSTTIGWSHNSVPLDCDASWAPDADLAQAGQIVVTPTVPADYAISCSADGAGNTAALTIKVLAYVPPPFPACLPADLSLTFAAIADARGVLRSYLGTVGLQEIVSTDHATSAEGWACDMPAGYSYAWFVIDWDSNDARCWRNISLRSVVERPFWEAVWEVCSRPLSIDEIALGAKLRAYYAAKFQVRAGAATRAVYRQNADGSRGAQLRINAAGQIVDAGGTLQTIAAGKPCDGKKRAALAGSSTRYHLVSGQTSVQQRLLPANVFSDCSILKAPPTGWPQG